MANDAGSAHIFSLASDENSKFNRKLTWAFILAGVLINCTGLFDTIFSGDSALYAVIAKSFATSGNFLDIYVNGQDWLDKPHFPFWLAALSMKVFGVSGFAYKLPSVILFLIGLIYTYKLANRLYDRDTALLAVLILTFALHVFISNNDVRAESILIGLIMGGVYHLYRASTGSGICHVAAGSLFCAAAITTKGPFVIIIFGSAICGHLIGNRDYRGLFSWKWLLAGFLTFVFVLPELFALYFQFDTHPEKEILGATDVSGLKFFVWDTQFGRFFNTGPFRGSGSPVFYLHTLLWTFAPWGLIAYLAIGRRIIDLVRRRPAREYLTLSGFIVMFIVFSASKFQLPYYVNILFPFLAVMCADWVMKTVPKRGLGLKLLWASCILLMLVIVPVIAGMEFAFGGGLMVMPTAVAAVLGVATLFIFRFEKRMVLRAVYCGAAAIGIFALYANLIFYPRLLQYQAGSQAAFYANANLPGVTIEYSRYDNLMEFYAKASKGQVGPVEGPIPGADKVYFVDDDFVAELDRQGIHYVVNAKFEDYRITRLTSQFLDPRTRSQTVTAKYLLTLVDPSNSVNVR